MSVNKIDKETVKEIIKKFRDAWEDTSENETPYFAFGCFYAWLEDVERKYNIEDKYER